ncbi:unnamed protein product [Durusdinium trenchii]|uniref:EF-hand domain-containing protein n=1 Tax=Durusdinium trenchii TaxID=1381693 RepID=A0ABP0IRT2_9DINO
MAMKLLLVALWAGVHALDGSIFFTNLGKDELMRADCGVSGCGKALPIAQHVETYSGLVPWNGRLLAALKSHQVVELDPWCQDTSCPVKVLVDVDRALPRVNRSFSLGGMTWCQDALYLVFAGPGASGVLRCACAAMPELTDCTESCKLVDGWTPGNASFQLSSFAAGAACDGERMLVTDNSNWRVQALNCSSGTVSCTVETVVKGLKWPLGIASIGGKLLVTLDEGIVELKEGSFSSWSSKGDTGFLCQGDGRILVASGGDGLPWHDQSEQLGQRWEPGSWSETLCESGPPVSPDPTNVASRLTTAPGSPEAAEALTGFPVAGGVPFATRLAFSAGTVQRDVQRLQPRHGAASRSAQVPQSLRSRSDAIGIVSLALGLRAGVRGRCRSSVRAGDDLRSFLLGEEPKEKEKPAAPAEPEKPAKPASTPAPKAAASCESAAAKKHLQDALHHGQSAPEWAKLNETFALLDSDGNGHISKDELISVVKDHGVDEKEVLKALEEVDADQDGEINYAEFVKLMKS